ncbi:methyl-accepting chemotaxis protein [Thermovibrio ammonificans]
MLGKFGIERKLLLFGLLGILTLALVLGFLSYRTTKENLIKEAFNRLTVIRESKKQHVEDYFDYMKDLLTSTSEDLSIKEFFEPFDESFYRLPSEVGVNLEEAKKALIEEYRRNYLPRVNYSIPGAPQPKPVNYYLPRSEAGIVAQYLFIVKNPYPVGEKNRLLVPQGCNATYCVLHEKIHKWIDRFARSFDLYDVFLIDTNGTIFYTDFKEKDFATNLLHGPYRDTGLARVFREALKAPEGTVLFADFKPYEPSYNQPAAFIAAPVYKGGRLLGVVAFQLPVDKIDAIVNFNYRFKQVGLGNTGEVYLVGEDHYLKNNVRFLKKLEEENPLVRSAGTTIEVLKVDNPAVERALAGESGVTFTKNFFGKKVLAAYSPVNVFGNRWAIVAEIEESEILADLLSLKKNRNLLVALVLMLFMVALFILFVKHTVVKPINQLSETARDLAEGEGDLTRELPIKSSDEVGTAARYFNAFIAKVRSIVESAKRSLARTVATATKMRELAQQVKARVQQEQQAVGEATSLAHQIANPLENFKETMKETVEQIQLANAKIASTLSSFKELKEVLDRTEEVSLSSISQLNNLAKQAEQITSVVQIIKDVTQRTNLLALNAAVEAARAGEAGRGFAVVAEEIRKLSEQIQKNTEQITETINQILNRIKETTSQISESSRENLETLRRASSTVVSQIEEATTIMDSSSSKLKEASNTAQELVEQVESLISEIEQISTASSQNAQVIQQILEKIQQIYKEVDNLNRILSQFKTGSDE